MPNKSRQPEDRTEPDGGDYAIYLPSDGLRETPPWRLMDYAENGAFTAEQKAELAQRFELPPECIEELSVLVGNSLDIESEVNLSKVTRSTAVKRGAARLEEAARLARRMRNDRGKLEAEIAPLSTVFSDSQDADERLAQLRHDLTQIAQVVAELEARIDRLLRSPGDVADPSPDDKRKLRDKRRYHVVQSCCHAWREAGRPVTYTTQSHDPDRPQRSGALIELVQTVVSYVTDPATEIPVETIRDDIDAFRRRSSGPDPDWEPPTYGR